MLSRSSRRYIARMLLCAMLFAQSALAAAACVGLRVAPAQALMIHAGEPTCHDEPAQNANLCLAHCLGSDQSADTPYVAIPVWSQTSPLVVVAFEQTPVRDAILHYTLSRPGAPPPRILFQSFLI